MPTLRLHHVLRRLSLLAVGSALALLAACSTVERGPAAPLERGASWVVLPFANQTDTPLAGERAQAVAQSLLISAQVGSVRNPPRSAQPEALFNSDDAQRQEEALAWARAQQLRYALTGSVQEWRYKVGVDGEPAVGLTLQIIDVPTGAIVWSGTGGQSGWSREALAAVAHKLTRKLLLTGLAKAQ